MRILRPLLWLSTSIFLVGVVVIGVYDRWLVATHPTPVPAPALAPICPDGPDCPDRPHFGVDARRLRRRQLCAD